MSGNRIDRYRDAERALWSLYDLSPFERFIEIGSPPVRIRILEVGSGPPILFAHGTAGSGPAFASLVRELHGFRCLLFDRPGFAFSSPVRYTASSLGTTAAHIQEHLLDALGISAADVIGHSIGGLFALRFALHRPARVRRIVLLGGGPIVDAAGVPPIIRLIASPAGGLFVGLIIKNRAATRAMLRGNGHGASVNDGRIPAAWIDWRTSVSRDTDSMLHERAMVRAIVSGSRFRPGLTFTDPELASLSQPTFMMLGTQDPVGSASLWARVIETIPKGRLNLVEGAGHMVWLDDPGRVADEVRRFFGKSSAAGD